MRSFPALFQVLADLLGLPLSLFFKEGALSPFSARNVRLLRNCCRGQRSEHANVVCISAPFWVFVAVRNLPDLSAHRIQLVEA